MVIHSPENLSMPITARLDDEPEAWQKLHCNLLTSFFALRVCQAPGCSSRSLHSRSTYPRNALPSGDRGSLQKSPFPFRFRRVRFLSDDPQAFASHAKHLHCDRMGRDDRADSRNVWKTPEDTDEFRGIL